MAGGAASGFGEPRAAVKRAARVLCNEGPASRSEVGLGWVRLGGASRRVGEWASGRMEGEERARVKARKTRVGMQDGEWSRRPRVEARLCHWYRLALDHLAVGK